MAGLEGLTIWERLQLGQATGWLTAMHAPLSDVLRKMEKGAASFPTRWVVHYTLGDYYGKVRTPFSLFFRGRTPTWFLDSPLPEKLSPENPGDTVSDSQGPSQSSGHEGNCE